MGASLAILAASLGWGLAGVGTRFVFGEGATTFTVVLARTGVATAAVAAYVVATRTEMTWAAWRDGLIIGIPRIGIAPAFFIGSLNYVSAGVEGLFITLIPVITSVMAFFAIGEHLDRNQIIGLALGLAGTGLLVVAGESGIADGSGDVVTGGLLAFGGVFFGSVSGVLGRIYAPRHSTAALSLPMFLVGVAMVSVIGFGAGDIAFAAVTPVSWWVLVALGLFSTLLPFVATLYAAAHMTAAKVALTGYLAPVVGVVAGAVLLGEVITGPIVIGGSLALAGVAMVGRSTRQPPDLVE